MRALPGNSEVRPLTDDERAALKRACEGDQAAIDAVKCLIKASPDIADRFFGDAAEVALLIAFDKIWASQPFIGDAVRAKMKTIRAGLAGDASSPLELLLIQRIVACWAYLAHADQLFASHVDSPSTTLIDQLEMRRDRAHRRYLSAIKALAQVRRLLSPQIQVNMAHQQVINNADK